MYIFSHLFIFECNKGIFHLFNKQDFLICRVNYYQVLLVVKIAQSNLKQTLTKGHQLHFMFLLLLPLQL